MKYLEEVYFLCNGQFNLKVEELKEIIREPGPIRTFVVKHRLSLYVQLNTILAVCGGFNATSDGKCCMFKFIDLKGLHDRPFLINITLNRIITKEGRFLSITDLGLEGINAWQFAIYKNLFQNSCFKYLTSFTLLKSPTEPSKQLWPSAAIGIKEALYLRKVYLEHPIDYDFIKAFLGSAIKNKKLRRIEITGKLNVMYSHQLFTIFTTPGIKLHMLKFHLMERTQRGPAMVNHKSLAVNGFFQNVYGLGVQKKIQCPVCMCDFYTADPRWHGKLQAINPSKLIFCS